MPHDEKAGLHLAFDSELAAQPSHDYQVEATGALLEALSPREPITLHVATAGGKTWTANNTVAEYLGGDSRRKVLWISKDWALLRQAVSDLCRRHRGFAGGVFRIGGERSELNSLPIQARRVGYTTIQTLDGQLRSVGRTKSRRVISRLAFSPTLIVWDESHWGERGKMGRKILSWARSEGIAVIGLTATPRCPSVSQYRIAYSIGFAELVSRGYIATPEPEEIQTGVQWTPRRASPQSDFSVSSIDELAEHPKRNQFIIEQLVGSRERYGKTILFACNIEHAECLVRALCHRGLRAAAIHSRQPASLNGEMMRRFDQGDLEILVNVAMATHGLDFPKTATVVVARPTLSDILYSQMIGRGARLHRASGKCSFRIVDFTDNMSRFDDMLVTAWNFFSGCPRGYRRCPPRTEHVFEPSADGHVIAGSRQFPEALHGLWYRAGQTFGVELEVLGGNRDAIAQTLSLALGAERVEAGLSPPDGFRRWAVGLDASVDWEVRSRVLEGPAGYEELLVALEILSSKSAELGLRLNHRTGFHVHIGWKPRSHYELKRLVRLVKLFEPALGTLVAPSRLRSFMAGRYLEEANQYCRPISSLFPRRGMGSINSMQRAERSIDSRGDSRNHTVNLLPLWTLGTIEVRMHSGTLEPEKVLTWVSLWQQILWAASEGDGVPKRLPCQKDRKGIIPDGDIIDLAKRYLPGGSEPRFLARLHARRAAIAEVWNRHPQLRGWVRHARGWGSNAA